MPSRDATQLKISRFEVTQHAPNLKPTWTIGEVRAALRAHAQGDFSLSAQLVDTMGEDDVLPGLVEKSVDAVLGSEFDLNAVDHPNRQQSKRLVAQWGPLWWDMFPEGEIGELYRWYRWLRVAIGVLDWERGADRWTPHLRTLHPQYLRWDDFRKTFVYSAKQGELDVTPGDGTWVMLLDGQRSWMQGSVRACALTWFRKQLTLRDWQRSSYRHGNATLLAYTPAIADDEDKEQFEEDAKAMEADGVAVLPTNLDPNSEKDVRFDLGLLEAKGTNYQVFEKLVDREDRRFMIHWLGANLGTEVTDQGARASADTHRGVEQSKAHAGGVRLSTDIRKQGLYPAIAFNVPGVTYETTPWPKWDTEPAADTKAEAEDQKAFLEVVKEAEAAGYDVENLDELAEKHGLELKKRETPPPAGAPGVPVPGQQAPANDPKEEDDQDDERQAARLLAQGKRLLSGALASENKGFTEGQVYIDALVAHAAELGVALLEPTLMRIERELEAADSYEDLKRRLRAAYEEIDAQALSDVVESVHATGELAGRTAVNEDA
jgi:hypothetical protein